MSDLTNKIKLLITGLNEDLGTVSKLYSTGIPNNATGDMVVSRTADTATRVNSSGNIETVVANKARIDFSLGVDQCPNLLVEKTIENGQTRTSQFTSASWTNQQGGGTTITITDNVIIAPDGTLTGGRVVNTAMDSGGKYFSLISQGRAAISGQSDIFGIWLKGDVGGEKVYVYGNDQKTECILTTEWVRYSVVNTATGTAIQKFYIGGEFGYMSMTAIPAQTFYLWNGQIQMNSVILTSDIINPTGSSISRNADVISKTGISALIPQTKGGLFFDGYLQAGSLSGGYAGVCCQISNSGTGHRIFLYRYNNTIYMTVQSGSTVVDMGTVITAPLKNKRIKLYASYEADNYKLYINGIETNADTAGALPATIDTIFIGEETGSATQWDGLIKAVAVTDELTLAEIEQLSSYSSFENMAEQMIYQMI